MGSIWINIKDKRVRIQNVSLYEKVTYCEGYGIGIIFICGTSRYIKCENEEECDQILKKMDYKLEINNMK